MKRLLTLFLCVVLIALLAACGSESAEQTSSDSSSADATEAEQVKSTQSSPMAQTADNTVEFKDALNWSENGTKSIYVHYWSSTDTQMTYWPGEKMTDAGDGTYRYLLPTGVEYLIFNNNGDKSTQTRDIPYDGTHKQFQASEKADELGCHYVTDWSGADISSNEVDDGTKKGKGDNDNLPLNVSLFGKEYTLGKTTVKELSADSWGKDSESWKEVDETKKIEFKDNGPSGLEMDNNTAEIRIRYRNLVDTFAVPEDCVLSELEFEGTLDGSCKKTDFSFFGGKIKPTDYTSLADLHEAMNNVLGMYKFKEEESEYSITNTYQIETKNGRFYIYGYQSKSDNSIKIDFSMYLSYDYTPAA